MSRIEMINKLTGMTMSVPEELVERYIKVGHEVIATGKKPGTAEKASKESKKRKK